MRKLKLFLSLLMVMLFSVGNVWAADVMYPDGNNFTSAWSKSSRTAKQTYASKTALQMMGKNKGVYGEIISETAYSNISSISINCTANNAVTLKLYYSADKSEWTELSSNDISKNTSSYSDYDLTITGIPSTAVYLKMESQANSVYMYSVTVSTGSADACSTPTFSPAAGAVASGTQVSITCSTDGAAIHYTTDGTDPTASSATYSAAIPVNSAMTIKAIAVKDGYDNSSVASAAYTVLTPLTTMDEIFAAATTAGSTATPVAITFDNWVVTGVKNSNAYVTDGTKGFIIYTASHGFQVGDILSGTAVCKVQLYNGSAELTELTTSKVTVNTGGSVSPVVLDAEGIAALTGANTGSVIKISGACTYENNKYYIAGVQLYNQLYSFSVSAGTNYECTGVYVQYNTTKEILPRSAADIVAQTSVANPTFSPAAGEYTEVQNVTLACTTNGATIYYTTDGTTPTNESAVYSSAITVDASMTIKAIAYKGEDHSEVVSATYTINLPVDPETTCTWDLSTTSYVADPEPTADLIQWTSTYVTMKAEKNGGSTGVNNYIPPTRTSTRFYTSNKITFIPANSKQITTIVITAATSGYATALKNATWTNATAAASGDTEVTITATGAGNVVGVLGSNTGITAVTVNYEPYVAPATYAVSFADPEHGSLAIANGDDPIASGDEFEEGTELTVSTEPASGYILDAIKVIETGSDPENDVTSTVLSGSTLTVPAYAITVSATFVENVAPEATLTLSENAVAAPFAGEHHQGDVVNLPLTSSAECVKEFVGWSANASCAVAPEYAPGAEYTLASTSQTLYAVYATASGTSYVKTALANIASGSEVVITEAKTVAEETTIWAASNDKGTSAAPVAVVVTEDEGVLSSEATNIYWIITKDGDNFSFAPKGGTGKLYCTSTNNGVRVGEGENNLFSINSDYLYNNGTTRFIGVQGEADWRCYTSINSTISGQTLAFYKKTATYSDYATTCVAALADPVFTPTAGVYTEAKNVVITAEEGTIYYTTDGTDPTSASTEYTAPIVLDANGTTTIKAIAISATSQSAIVSATYTINMPLSTMDQIFAAATAAGSTATDVNIAFGNWVVSGVSTNGKNVFVTDGTKGFIIFDNGGEMGFAVGDVLSGTVACKVQLYKGAAELTTLSSTTEGLNIAKEGVITPVVKAINALSGINTGAPVTINSVQFDGEFLTDGVNSIKPFNSLFAYEALENGKYYNVTGIYQQFDATKEILPRSAADIEAVDLDDPELSYSPASVSLEVGQALSAPTFNNPHEVSPINYEVSGDAVATVTNEGVIALVENATGTATITASFAGNAQYAVGNATFTITVNPASVSENVVIIAEYDSKFYALTNSISNKTAAAVEVEKDGDKIVVPSNEAKVAIQWTKRTSGENTTFQDANDKYLKGVSNGGDLTVVDAVCNWSWNATDEYYYIGSRSFIYRESANGFKNYAVSNAGSSDYSAIAEVRVIDPANIVVTTKVDPELAFNPEEVTLTVGDAFVAPVLGYVEGFDGLAAVTYESSNTDLATVEGGVVSLVADATGTATITATFAGNNNYLAGSASYTITVNAPAPVPTTTTYRKVTATEEITDGEYLIVYETTSVAFNGALETLDAEGNSVAVVINEGVIAGTTAIDAAVFTIDVTAGTLKSASGKYIGVSSNSNGLKQTEDASTYTHTFSIDGDGNAVIFANFESSTMKLRYNPSTNAGNLRFRYYKNDGQQAIQLYKKESATPEPPVVDYTEVRDGLTAGWYYTMCLDKAVTAVKAGSIWRVLSKAANGKDVILEEVIGTLDAGRPYIFRAAASTLEVAYTGDAVGAPVNDEDNNGLVGSFTQQSIEQSPNNFIIYNNALYFVNTDNVYVGANRAYLDMTDVPDYVPSTPAPGRRRVTMAVYGEQTATGMDALNATDAPVKMMINGQMYILRGEKMYDATGRLVK